MAFIFFLYSYYFTNIVTPCSINIVTTGLKENEDGEEGNEKKTQMELRKAPTFESIHFFSAKSRHCTGC